jgi:hypothetical protein
MKQAFIIAAVLITIAPTHAQLRDGAYSWSDVHSGKGLKYQFCWKQKKTNFFQLSIKCKAD